MGRKAGWAFVNGVCWPEKKLRIGLTGVEVYNTSGTGKVPGGCKPQNSQFQICANNQCPSPCSPPASSAPRPHQNSPIKRKKKPPPIPLTCPDPRLYWPAMPAWRACRFTAGRACRCSAGRGCRCTARRPKSARTPRSLGPVLPGWLWTPLISRMVPPGVNWRFPAEAPAARARTATRR